MAKASGKPSYIDSVEIAGFWGRKNVSLKLFEDLNFLIGPNGCGKTTIINLISAVLRADISVLYGVQFKKTTIRLKSAKSRIKPIIEVEKLIDKKMGSFKLEYTIKENSSTKGVKYGVEGPNDERLYRDYRYPRIRRHFEEGARLGRILSDFVEVNWLSIHRANIDIERKLRRDEGYESSVDQKLHELSRAFSQYFSLLTSKAKRETNNFQEKVFLSLLERKNNSKEIFKPATSESEDKDTVEKILLDLGVSPQKATSSVNKYFSRLQDARNSIEDKNKVSVDDALTLYDALRVTEMIKEWNGLQAKLDVIFEPRNKFEKIMNSLFSGKEIHFDDRSVPMIHLESGEKIAIEFLSSGEKQLFILLGEALLQEERPVVFISDEPELSLHVSWQSSLFKNIRSLNNHCQIISATHSPDIVGAFDDRVIQIEKCMSDVC